jgi:hypothetical protein
MFERTKSVPTQGRDAPAMFALGAVIEVQPLMTDLMAAIADRWASGDRLSLHDISRGVPSRTPFHTATHVAYRPRGVISRLT